MAIVIMSHTVRDYDQWKPHYDRDVARREGAGIKEIKVGQAADDKNLACMVWELADVSVIDKMMADPDLKAKMEEAGVTGPPQVQVIL